MKAVNLLPPDQRGAAKLAVAPVEDRPGAGGAYAVLGALAVGVAAVAGYVLTDNTIAQRHAQVDGLVVHEQVLQAKVTELKPYADAAQMASARVATIKDLASRRFDWDGTLRDLSHAVPPAVTVKSLTADLGGASGGGGSGGSSLRGAIAAPAISLTGCTTSQREVAKLMARLRNVNGVTRVSLSSSSKPDQATASTASAVGSPTAGASGGTQTACPQGSPPEFDLVMFFEHAAAATQPPAAAGAAGVSTTASTSASAGVTP